MTIQAMKSVVAALAAVVLCGTATTAGATEQQAESITCDASSSGKPASFYDGESASYAYDTRFTKGPAVPEGAHTSYSLVGKESLLSWTGGPL